MKNFKILGFALLVMLTSLIFAACGESKESLKTFNEADIQIVETEFTYDKTPHAFTLSYAGAEDLVVSYAEEKNGNYVSAQEFGKINANSAEEEYSAYYRLSAKGYKTYLSDEPVSFKINPRSVKINLDSDLFYYNINQPFSEKIFNKYNSNILDQDSLGEFSWSIVEKDSSNKFPNAVERETDGWANDLVGKTYDVELMSIGNTNYVLPENDHPKTSLKVVNNFAASTGDGEPTYFANLADALASSGENLELSVYSDVELDEVVEINNSLVINGNNHVISAKQNFQTKSINELNLASLFYIPNNSNATLTLKDLVLNGNKTCRAISAFAGNLELENVSVINGQDKDSYRSGGLYVSGNSTALIKNSSIITNLPKSEVLEGTENYYNADLWVGANAQVTVEGNSQIGYAYVNANTFSAQNKGGLKLTKGTINHVWLEYDADFGGELSVVEGSVLDLKVDQATGDAASVQAEHNKKYVGGSTTSTELN